MAFGIDDAIAAGLKVIDKFVPDPAAKAKAEAELRADLLASDRAQMEVNKAEAQTGSLFIGGWRPAIGWVLAAAVPRRASAATLPAGPPLLPPA